MGGVCRKLLSLVKLYQRFWIWNIDQNLNMALLIVAACTVQMRFSWFWKCLKATWLTRESHWINSKIRKRDKDSTLIIFLFCYYCWSLLWCNCWRCLMLRNSASFCQLSYVTMSWLQDIYVKFSFNANLSNSQPQTWVLSKPNAYLLISSHGRRYSHLHQKKKKKKNQTSCYNHFNFFY